MASISIESYQFRPLVAMLLESPSPWSLGSHERVAVPSVAVAACRFEIWTAGEGRPHPSKLLHCTIRPLHCQNSAMDELRPVHLPRSETLESRCETVLFSR